MVYKKYPFLQNFQVYGFRRVICLVRVHRDAGSEEHGRFDDDTMAKTILEQFQFNVKIIRICSKICGADITDPNYRVDWITWCVVAMIMFYFSTTFYTVYANVVINEEWTVYLQIMCMVGSGAQVEYCQNFPNFVLFLTFTFHN